MTRLYSRHNHSEEVISAFSLMDTDGDGVLSVSDMQLVLKERLNMELHPVEVFM